MQSFSVLDERSCEALVVRVSSGDGSAWQEFVELVWPHLVRQIGSHRRALGEGAEDEARTIATAVLEKLYREEFRALRGYFDWKGRQPEKTFGVWLFTVSRNVTRDHARSELGRHRPGADDVPSAKRLLNEASSSGVFEQLGFRPPITTQQTARQLLEVARSRLEAMQYRALELWLHEYDGEEIAGLLNLSDPEAAMRLVRAAVAVLRRLFTVTGK